MTKRKTHQAATLQPGPCPEALYDQALAELQITVPVYTCRVVGSRLEFRLYGGRVLYWPAGDAPAVDIIPERSGVEDPHAD